MIRASTRSVVGGPQATRGPPAAKRGYDVR